MRQRRRVWLTAAWWAAGVGGAPRWVIALVAVVVAVAVPLLVLADRAQTPVEQALGGRSELARQSVTVIGDSLTSGPYGEAAGVRWHAIVGDTLDVDMQVLGVDGTGYVTYNTNVPQSTFVTRATAVSRDADVVVIFGSRSDVNQGTAVHDAAIEAFAAVRERAPEATLIVVGPSWPDDDPPVKIVEDRDALAAAAAEVGVQWVDPISEGWLTQDPGYVTDDGRYATDSGQVYLATKLAPIIESALPPVDSTASSR